MLDFMRSRAKSTWIKGLFLVIALVFVFVGVGSFGDDPQVQILATIDGETITSQEFERAYRNVESNYREIYKERFSPELMQSLNLRQETLDRLVDAKLLLREAERIGFRASDTDVRKEIAAFPAFQSYGSFSNDSYRRVLRYLRLTPRQFEEEQRNRIVVERFRGFIEGSVRATDDEVTALYEYEQTQANLSFIKIVSSDLVDMVEVNPDALKTFYGDNRETFRTPERVRLRYVAYDAQDFQEDLVITSKEVETFYKNNLGRFAEAKQVRARHILLTIDESDSEELKRTKRETAEGLLRQIREGEDFATLAENHSEDPGTAPDGGDLGFFGAGDMVQPFEQAAFNMKAGEISDIVESSFGLHLIKVESIKPEREKPLEEVTEVITAELLGSAAKKTAEQAVRRDRKLIGEGTTISELAGSPGRIPGESPLVAKNETIPGVTQPELLINTALGQSPGQISQPIKAGDSWYLVSLTERIPSQVPEFEEVKENIEARYRSQQAEILATDKAEKLFAKVSETKNLEDLAKAEGLQLEETGLFTRRGAYIPKIGSIPELKNAAFKLHAGEPIAPQSYSWGGNAFVVALKELLPADAEELEERRDELRQALLQRKRNTANREFVTYLKKKVVVEYNRENALKSS